MSKAPLIRKPRVPIDVILRAHADYGAGFSLAAVARKHGRHPKSLRDLFKHRGLTVREDPRGKSRKLPNGQVAAVPPLTREEIDDLIANARRITVPRVLKQEWRRWSLGKRSVFIERIRGRLRSIKDRPEKPFSANVVPFDYGTPEAWEIARSANAGRASQRYGVKIKPCSQGVIWESRLWFWSHKYGYQCGPWTREGGRPALHQVIWERAHGRPIPAHHVLIFLDGNRNNLVAENLALKSRGDLAIDNKETGRANARRTRQFFQMSAAAGAIAHAL